MIGILIILTLINNYPESEIDWDAIDEISIQQMYDAGYSEEEIEELLDRSPNN